MSEKALTAEEPKIEKPKILLVEYSRPYSEPLEKVLRARGYDVKVVDTGNEAAAELGITLDVNNESKPYIVKAGTPATKYETIIITGSNVMPVPSKNFMGGLDFISALNTAVLPEDGKPPLISKKNIPPIIVFSGNTEDRFSDLPIIGAQIFRHPVIELYTERMENFLRQAEEKAKLTATDTEARSSGSDKSLAPAKISTPSLEGISRTINQKSVSNGVMR